MVWKESEIRIISMLVSKMKIKQVIKLSLIFGLFLTITSPLWFAKSVQNYFPGELERFDYQWKIYGGWFRNVYYHEAWPEFNIEAEWKLVPFGILFSYIMWSLIVFTFVISLQVFKRIYKEKS